MILKRQKIGSFQLVHELKGMAWNWIGRSGKKKDLIISSREPHFQLFRETATEIQVEVSSIAMSGFWAVFF